jgi:hypothetical protein
VVEISKSSTLILEHLLRGGKYETEPCSLSLVLAGPGDCGALYQEILEYLIPVWPCNMTLECFPNLTQVKEKIRF